ncbi:hypothetical protein [Nocardia sp. NPDC051570]|uniref:hypothetical protein n=1 Tax=Nocardia sp. NPDC051570 TaxID=3364324 RepID=UPI0037BB1146
MTDKLANARAFLARAETISAGKSAWENSPGSGMAMALRSLVFNLRTTIERDDRGSGSGTPTDVYAKKFASELYRAGLIVQQYSDGGLTPTQQMLFGDPSQPQPQPQPFPNPGFIGDLVTALQKDDPTWKP